MKVLNSFFALIVLALTFTGCKNDVDLNAPYKEIPSIYAVLNPSESVHTIRINKVFLGEGDANVMAKVSDSVNYGPGELAVTLDYKASHFGKTVSGSVTFTEAIVETAPGAFSTSQRVYQTDETLPSAVTIWSGTNSASPVLVYTLTILNKHTGNVFTATASPVQKVFVDNIDGDLRLPHLPDYPALDKVQEKDYTDYVNRTGSVYFPPSRDGSAIYKLIISTVYYNIVGSEKLYDAVDYVFDNRYPREATYLGGTFYIVTSFKPVDYFGAISVALSKKNIDKTIYRKVEEIDYHIYASTQAYLDYLEYAKPSLSFNQNKPLYSNFVNNAAIGIFTFRSESVVRKLPSKSFINSFSYRPETCEYRFYDVNDHWQGCN